MKRDGTGEHYVKQNKPDSERQLLHVFPQMWYLWGERRHGSRRGTTREERDQGRGEEDNEVVKMIKVHYIHV
jgi:hypothetical protein